MLLPLFLAVAIVFGTLLDAGISRQTGLLESKCDDSQKFEADSPDPADGNSMEGTERSGKGHDVCITVPALITGGGPECRRPVMKAVCYTTFRETNYSRFSDLTTTASISSKKAHELTLVGAKPSGTG
jgi:hypothetical protein